MTDTRPAAPAPLADAMRTPGREAIPDIARLLQSIDTCTLVSRGEGGLLHGRPMSNNGEVEWDGSSWFFAPAGGRLVAEIREDPEVMAAYQAGDRFAWVALSGTAEVIDDREAKRRLWLTELERWFPGGPEDPSVALIRVESTAAHWWSEQGEGTADLRIESE